MHANGDDFVVTDMRGAAGAVTGDLARRLAIAISLVPPEDQCAFSFSLRVWERGGTPLIFILRP
jgi:hypothetical protein